MSQQLVLAINNTSDNFRWCWLQDGQPQLSASGNLDALRQAIGELNHQVWLLLPGAKVVTRELEFTDKEKKHLRSLLPFQLEDSVVGDIDELHFALGDASKGKVTVSYTDKNWLRDIFEQLTSIGLEITRCWSAPTLLPFNVTNSQSSVIQSEENIGSQEIIRSSSELEFSEVGVGVESLDLPAPSTWVIALHDGVVNLRFNAQQGFTLPKGHFATALSMLLSAQGLSENLPNLILRANSEEDLATLRGALPENLAARVSCQLVVDEWELDFEGKAIDLCQAEFSQRLPIERWFKVWRGVGMLALVTVVVYMGVLMLHVSKLSKQNVAIRQQTEALFRTVVPHGPSDDPERKLRTRLADMQPKAQTGSVVGLMAGVLPIIASSADITVKMISYTADTGEMAINVQAHSFNSIDGVQKLIEAQGFKAELLSSSAQGDINSARLKISKP